MERATVIKIKQDQKPAANSAEKAGLSDVAVFFVGSRKSIIRLAAAPHTLWLGIALVLTAGLARNYDHHHLILEPLWIIGPVSMAFISSLFIYTFFEKICGLRSESGFRKASIISAAAGVILGPTFGFPFALVLIGGAIVVRLMAVNYTLRGRKNFLAFLRCFLMTAPIAWIYGIPVEMWVDPAWATRINFMLLVIVALWRVFLMIRVVQVLYQPGYLRAAICVLLPASMEMYIGSIVLKSRMISIMGGISEEYDPFLMSATSIIMTTCAILTGCGILAWVLLKYLPRYVSDWDFLCRIPQQGKHFRFNVINLSRNAWILPVAGLFLFGIPAIKNQSALANRIHLRQLISEGHFSKAADLLNTTAASDFPGFDTLGISVMQTLEFMGSGEEIPEWAQKRINANLDYFAHRIPYNIRAATRMSKYSADDRVHAFIRKWIEIHLNDDPEKMETRLDEFDKKRQDLIDGFSGN